MILSSTQLRLKLEFKSRSLLVWDKTKIMLCHLLTEVVVEVEDELDKYIGVLKFTKHDLIGVCLVGDLV